MATPPAKDDRAVIKIHRDTHDTIKELLAHVSRNGWASLGIGRDDPPSLGGLIDEAIRLLATRQKKRGGEK
jgi:hypothetical protein